jgi:hypothetical protein
MPFASISNVTSIPRARASARADAHELEVADQLVLSYHLALALVHLDLDRP